MKKISQKDIMNALDSIYAKCLDGIPVVSKSVEEMSNEYLNKYHDKREATRKMLDTQIAKCTTSGFINGFGGIITLPVTIPANISEVLYVQMRMIASAAYISGYDLKDDETQTFVYACLAGVSLAEIVKKFGVNFGKKLALVGVKKIPGNVLKQINQKVGFRLLTKFGEKGLLNFGKMIPVVGAAINGGFDFAETKIIADRAYKIFILKDYKPGKGEEIIYPSDVLP